jgi:hypothetical protein
MRRRLMFGFLLAFGAAAVGVAVWSFNRGEY